MSGRSDVIVIGGGLAGLVAAVEAARAGVAVELFETLKEPGGRARTRQERGFLFNMGPHALYAQGPGRRILEELGVPVRGAPPPLSGSLARHSGELHRLPVGVLSLLTTGLLGLSEKRAAARFLATLPRLDTAELDAVPLAEALEGFGLRGRARELVLALVRLSTYVHAPEQLSAGAALAQLKMALSGGVLYLDGGWQSLVNGLLEAIDRSGARLHRGTFVRHVEPLAGALRVTTRDGSSRQAAAVVVAVEPARARELLAGAAGEALGERVERFLPARVASLELGLERLPVPRRRFALGIDEPTYFSVHTPTARLSEREGGEVLHVARYLAPDEKPERFVLQEELEGLVDRLQPGWRDVTLTRKLLSELCVCPGIPRASSGGLAGRPPVRLAEHRGVYLAGDWVGATGQLADAALASGREAGRLAAAWTGAQPPS
ncbi:MAG: phytoene desaturase family protein [Myxococcota bacterium]